MTATFAMRPVCLAASVEPTSWPSDPSQAAADPARASWQLPQLQLRKGSIPPGRPLDTLRLPQKSPQTGGESRRFVPSFPAIPAT